MDRIDELQQLHPDAFREVFDQEAAGSLYWDLVRAMEEEMDFIADASKMMRHLAHTFDNIRRAVLESAKAAHNGGEED